MSSNRDDFPLGIKRSMAERVGFLCSNPDCRVSTSGPQTKVSKSVNIGVAAHVTAASEGGPRYDPSLDSDERAGITNGIWLCQNCAKLVDNDPLKYSAELLRQWKIDAEQEAHMRLGKKSLATARETEVVDKWVSMAYVEKAGITKKLQEEGYELRWTNANKECERIDLEGWEQVILLQSDGKQACLKIKDHPAIGGYVILLKKKKK